MASSSPLDLGIANADYIDHLYQQYRASSAGIDARWYALFDAIENASTDGAASTGAHVASSVGGPPVPIVLEVANLVHAYRELGHFTAHLDPLGNSRPDHPFLALKEYGLNEALLDQTVGNGGFLGDVSEIHCVTNRPIWPQGGPRPDGEDPVPANVNWDLWLGPAPRASLQKRRLS